jgi:gas vesicle structural protein
MTVASQGGGGGGVERYTGGGASGLGEVVELILDKGLVVDVFARVSLVGIEILSVDARVVVASVDTYLRFAEATNRLDLYDKGGKTLPEMVEGMTESSQRGKGAESLDTAADKIGQLLGGRSEETDEADEETYDRPRRRARERVREQER